MIEEALDGILDVFHFNGWFQFGDLNLDPEDKMVDRPPGSNTSLKAVSSLSLLFVGHLSSTSKSLERVSLIP